MYYYIVSQGEYSSRMEFWFVSEDKLTREEIVERVCKVWDKAKEYVTDIYFRRIETQ